MINFDGFDRDRGFERRRRGRPRLEKPVRISKCDVRLDEKEEQMLSHLAESAGVTRSDVFRKALRDYYTYNTEGGE